MPSTNADWIKLSKNGVPYAEKDGIVTTKGNKVRIQTYLGNPAKNVKPGVSFAHIWYNGPDNRAHRSKNTIVICDTRHGRDAYFKRVTSSNAPRQQVQQAPPAPPF